jgi:hypothetical protein
LASKICQTKDLVSHDFGYYLVGYQNLPTSHIWLAKSMATFLPNFGLPNLWHGIYTVLEYTTYMY